MKPNYESMIFGNPSRFKKETSPQIAPKGQTLSWRISVWVLLLAIFVTGKAAAQVSNYPFAQSTATYTPLASPTTLFAAGWDDGVSNATIPFAFNFNGIAYTIVRVNTNGYVTFGTTTPATNSFTPISSTTAYAGAISAFGHDLVDNGSTIVTGVEGSSPNRVFVIQWNNARRYSLGAITGDVLNFQIRLYETSNKAEVRYGTCTATNTAAFLVQGGLRGATNADFNNRTTASNWSATAAGTANTDTLTTTNAIMPASGLTFTWSRPPACSGPPSAGTVSPASSVACTGIAPAPITVTGQTTGVSGLTYLWQESDDNGVTDAWANAVGGSGNTTLTYSPPVLTATKYYRLRIVCSPNAAFSASGVITVASCTAPANDNPCGAVALTPSASCTAYSDTGAVSTTNVVNATTTTTNGVVSPTCSGAGASVNDVWFKFTATATTHGITVTPVAGFDAAFQIYGVSSGTCAGSNLVLSPISCVNTAGDGAAEQGIFGMTAGQDYYIRVYRHPSGVAGTAVSNSQFSICVFNPIPACTSNSAPADLATNIGLTPTLSWNAATYADSYDVYLGTASGPTTLLANTASTSYTLTAGQALNSVTQYFWYVVPKNASGAASCGAANQTRFTTLNNCSAPTNPTASAVTHISATVSWTAASPAPANGYLYEIRTSGAAGSGATGLQASGSTVAGDTNDNVTGLAQATTYNLYVRSSCSVSDLSEWTAAYQFTTGQIFPPFVNSFFPGSICSNGDASARTVIITGTNFTGVTAVTFNGVNAQSFTVDSSAQITAVVASGSTSGNVAVTNADGTGTSTNILVVNNPPVVANITAPGGATHACIGTPLTLSDATSGGVWSSSNETAATVDNSGVVTALAFGSVTITYTVTSGTTGCTAFKTYALDINEPVTIHSNTPSHTIASGADTSFSVSATGTGNPALAYQWQVCTDGSGVNFTAVSNDSHFSGATSAVLSITNAPLSFNGYVLRCAVTGICGTATSNAATLSVSETEVTDEPDDVAICDFGNANFTIVASADATAYQWQEDQGGNNWHNVVNNGIYSGASTASLTLTGVTAANNGWKYRCQVTGFTSDTSNAATLTVNQSVQIFSITPTHTIAVSNNTAFGVTAAGTGDPLTYEWQVSTDGGTNFSTIVDGAPFSNATTATLSITNAPLSFNGYVFRCIVTGVCGSAFSAESTLFVGQTTVVDQPDNFTLCDLGNADFTIVASGDATAYQWQEDQGGNNWQNLSNTGIYTGATTATLTLTGVTVANNGWKYRCRVTGLTADTSDAAILTVNTSVESDPVFPVQSVAVNGNTSVSVVSTGTGPLSYQWSVCTDGSNTNFTSVSDTGHYSGSTTATLSLTNVPQSFDGYRFRCEVTGACGSATSGSVDLFVSETTIIGQPDDVTLCQSGNAVFNVSASADATGYQWQEDQGGNNWHNIGNTGIYSGTATANMTLTGVTVAKNGWRYRCQVTGLTVTVSDAATLNVHQAVAIVAQPGQQNVCTSGGTSVFTVGASGSVADYQWQFSADNGNTWNNVSNGTPSGATYSGAATASLAVTTSAATPVVPYYFRAIVNGTAPCGVVNSDGAQLVINAGASVTWYVDADGDGYGNNALPTIFSCTQPAGYAAVGGDCDDSVGTTHPNAIEIAYNGVDDDCDGTIDETGTLTTSLLPSACGATLSTIGSIVGITTIAEHTVTGYRIRATNGAQVQIIETNVPHFNMTQFTTYAYATTYSIDIQLQREGIWQASWGPACAVSTPAILQQGGAGSINPAQCGITLAKINTLIATTSLAGVTGYRFRLTNLTDPSGPNAVQVLDRSLNWFSLQMLTRYNYGTTYNVEVAVKTTGDFGAYGAPCQVSSPAVPTLTNCGATIASMGTPVGAASLAAITQYRFEVVRASDGMLTTIDRNVSYFTFANIPATAFTAGALYHVRVAVMTTGVWSPFSSSCDVTAPGAAAKGVVAASVPDVPSAEFKATASPNPYTSEFSVDVITSSGHEVQLKVYDMLGKLIEIKTVNASELHIGKIGSDYPSGVYNVIVNQGENVKTLRVIKR